MNAQSPRHAFWGLLSDEERAAETAKCAAAAERRAQITGLAALFGISWDDAQMIRRDFQTNPDNRRSADLTKHTALTLRARKRFLSGGRKAVAA